MSEVTRTVGRYEIVRVIGRGGMATVYLARQTELRRLVALKEMYAFRTDHADLVKRFIRESQLSASLSHPNIITVHELFEDAGVPYISMEYVESGSLRDYMDDLSLAQAAGVLEGMLAGLAHAGERDIVHRDIKPENVMVGSDGRVKIADFGIARARDRLADWSMLTAAGTTVGTPAYMAPEQALAGDLDPRTDLYSVGVVAYEMLVGRRPFPSDMNPAAALVRLVQEPIPEPRSVNPSLAEPIAEWLERMLQKDAADRFADATEAWEALEEHVIASAGPRWRRDAQLAVRPAPVAAPAPEPSAAGVAPAAARGGTSPADVLTPPPAEPPGGGGSGTSPWTPPPSPAVPPLSEAWLDQELEEDAGGAGGGEGAGSAGLAGGGGDGGRRIRLGRSGRAAAAVAVVAAAAGVYALASSGGDDSGGAAAPRYEVQLISRATGLGGAASNQASAEPTVAPGGRYVVFSSAGSNLASGDRDTRLDIFLRDLRTHATTLISRASGAAGAKSNGASGGGVPSADGRIVVFDSDASNLDPADHDRLNDIYARDRVTNRTVLATRATGVDGAKANGPSGYGTVSANGRYAAFWSAATNLSAADHTTAQDIYVRDLVHYGTTLVSRADGPGGVVGNGTADDPAISADGRYVVFTSEATNLTPDDRDKSIDVYVRDMRTGRTELVSRATGRFGAKANAKHSYMPSISADGRYAAFTSDATNLSPQDADSNDDVFVRDLKTHATSLVSRATSGVRGDGSSYVPALSADGRYIVFDSNSTNLAPGDANREYDIFVRDMRTQVTRLISRKMGSGAPPAKGKSINPTSSADGRVVTFSSTAGDIVAGDRGGLEDIFVEIRAGAEP